MVKSSAQVMRYLYAKNSLVKRIYPEFFLHRLILLLRLQNAVKTLPFSAVETEIEVLWDKIKTR